jgi:hypothetical protein
MTRGRLYWCEAIIQRLPQDLQDMAAARRPCLQAAHPVVREGHLTRHRYLTPPISPTSEMVWWGARNGRVMTRAVRAPVRPATRWMRVVPRASARGVAGRMVVSRRASIDVPAPGGPIRRT